METVILILSAFVGGWAARSVFSNLSTQFRQATANSPQRGQVKDFAVTARQLTIDHESGAFLLYDQATGEFLAQGETVDQALENLQRRFPKQDFFGTITKEQSEKWGIKLEEKP